MSLKSLTAWLFTLAMAVPGRAFASLNDVDGAGDSDRIHSESGFNGLDGVVASLFTTLIYFLPAVATFYLALSGYRYIVAQGSPELVEKAKKSLTYAVFGVIIAYSSAAIIFVVAKQFGLNPGFQ